MLLHSCVSGKLRINPSNLKCSSQYAQRVYGLASFPDPYLRNGGGCWGQLCKQLLARGSWYSGSCRRVRPPPCRHNLADGPSGDRTLGQHTASSPQTPAHSRPSSCHVPRGGTSWPDSPDWQTLQTDPGPAASALHPTTNPSIAAFFTLLPDSSFSQRPLSCSQTPASPSGPRPASCSLQIPASPSSLLHPAPPEHQPMGHHGLSADLSVVIFGSLSFTKMS